MNLFNIKRWQRGVAAFVADDPQSDLRSRVDLRLEEIEEEILNLDLRRIRTECEIECAQKSRQLLMDWRDNNSGPLNVTIIDQSVVLPDLDEIK